jgi:preprotein translocase subunit YajC
MRFLFTAILFPAFAAFAQQDSTPTTATGSAANPAACLGGGGGIEGFIPIVAMIAIFYFLIIRPQQKQQKQLRNLRESLKKDDRVITSGGIHGTVFAVKGDVVSIRIAEGVKIDVDKSAVASIDRRQEGEIS